jgi:hypothetical protein
VKVKELSLLIVSEDKSMRQQLAALVSDRYRSVTAAAPEKLRSLMASKSFDLEMAIERAEMSCQPGQTNYRT